MSSSFSAARFSVLPLSKEKEQLEVIHKDTAPGSVEPSDDSLISKIREGDQEALAVLFSRYARLVWSISERIVRNQAEADDLLQDVFLRIRRRASVFDSSKGSVRSLIVHMTYQEALSRRRYLNSRSCHVDQRAEDRVAAMATAGVRRYDETIEAQFGRERAREALEDLSEDQKKTLRLFFRGGYTLNEIAELLGQSLGQVKHHYYRGLQRLRKRLLNGSG